MIVRRLIEYTIDDELPMIGGHADGLHHPYELTDDEADELVEERREALARKRPPGFAPWPEDQPEGAL
jgi:hypothetical protein